MSKILNIGETIFNSDFVGYLSVREELFGSRTLDSVLSVNLLGLIKKSPKPSTRIYTPFTSSYSSSASSYELQGIKFNPYGSRRSRASYIITGTTGNAFGPGAVGAVYVALTAEAQVRVAAVVNGSISTFPSKGSRAHLAMGQIFSPQARGLAGLEI
jgi:hypothetical protein